MASPPGMTGSNHDAVTLKLCLWAFQVTSESHSLTGRLSMRISSYLIGVAEKMESLSSVPGIE